LGFFFFFFFFFLSLTFSVGGIKLCDILPPFCACQFLSDIRSSAPRRSFLGDMGSTEGSRAGARLGTTDAGTLRSTAGAVDASGLCRSVVVISAAPRDPKRRHSHRRHR
jgi:hypothetical protein